MSHKDPPYIWPELQDSYPNDEITEEFSEIFLRVYYNSSTEIQNCTKALMKKEDFEILCAWIYSLVRVDVVNLDETGAVTQRESINLSTEILSDCEPLINHDKTVEGYQQRYLFSMAQGCLLSSKSYLMLREADLFHDLPVIARVMLERDIYSIYASESVENAVRLLIKETSVNRMEMLDKIVSPEEKDKDDVIKRYEVDISNLTDLIGPGEVPQNAYSYFKLVGLEDLYRSAYFRLSESVHGHFQTGFDSDLPIGLSNYIASVSLLNSALAVATVVGLNGEFANRMRVIKERAEFDFGKST